jgi:hypothetical protein
MSLNGVSQNKSECVMTHNKLHKIEIHIGRYNNINVVKQHLFLVFKTYKH